MRKKNIKILTAGILACAAFTMAPNMANAATTEEENQMVSVDELVNLDADSTDEDSEEEIEYEVIKGVDKEVKIPKAKEGKNKGLMLYARSNSSALTNFWVDEYSDSKTHYKYNNQSIRKSKLPLNIVAIQTGMGNISYISIDGKEVTSRNYDYNRKVYSKLGSTVTAWENDITIDKSVVQALSNGTHTVKIVCSPSDRWTVGSNPITAQFTFNLVD